MWPTWDAWFRATQLPFAGVADPEPTEYVFESGDRVEGFTPRTRALRRKQARRAR